MHDKQPVSCSNTPDRMHEALASHALPLEVRRFVSSRNGDNLEIVDQDFEIARFLFAVKAKSLKIAKERAQCRIHWNGHDRILSRRERIASRVPHLAPHPAPRTRLPRFEPDRRGLELLRGCRHRDGTRPSASPHDHQRLAGE